MSQLFLGICCTNPIYCVKKCYKAINKFNTVLCANNFMLHLPPMTDCKKVVRANSTEQD